MLKAETLWQAVETRDKAFADKFFYGVLTTGIFCRPGCPARTPKRENVRFYQALHQAQAAGLRPCLRCRPLENYRALTHPKLKAICNFIRHNLECPAALTLANLSRRCQLSPYHFQRTFKAVIGVTPKQYVEAMRMQTLKHDLKSASSVTDAIYSAGFSSSSRVYARADVRLGMTPRQYRSGGKDVALSYVSIESPLGLMMLAATDRGLCFLEFGDSAEQLLQSLRDEFPASTPRPMPQPYSEQFIAWMQALSNYLAGHAALPSTLLALHGTAFQLKVWNYLQTIPEGSSESYSKVAEAIGHPSAVRAVAGACAANRVALVVPCHRVIRGDGALGGYRWGLDRKRSLLAAERRTAIQAASQTSSDPSEPAIDSKSCHPEQSEGPAVDSSSANTRNVTAKV